MPMKSRESFVTVASAAPAVRVVVMGRRLLETAELRCRLVAHLGDERHGRTNRRNPDVALHLLVQRRAEVGAVERVDADVVRYPAERARFSRGDDQLRVVVAEHRETVEDVPIL